MIDLNRLNYRERPFSQVKQYAVYPLSDKGFNEYISKDSYARKYLNKADSEVYQDLDEVERKREMYQIVTENEKGFTPIETETKKEHYHNSNLQDKIKHCFQINDIEDEETNKDVVINKRAKTSQNFFKPPILQDNNNLSSTNLDNKEYNPILRGPQCKINNFPQTSSQGIYNKKNKFYTTSKYKVLNGRFNSNYLTEIEKLSQNSSYRGNTFKKQKGYDGFESYRVPRTKIRAKSEYKVKSLVDNYSRQMMNTLKLGVVQGHPADQNKLRQLCQEENVKLKMIFNNQSNPHFLEKSKLPQISSIINQPRFLLSNSRTQYSKNLGEKYNPFNYKVDNKNHFKRNIGGSQFQY